MSNEKIAFIFPGQGAQYPGMGKDIYDAFPCAKALFDQADDILQTPFSKLIFEGSLEELKLTRNSQVAIYIVSAALLAVLSEQFPDLKPNVCAGLSLGEYTALYASGRISFAEGLKLVWARARYMQEACEKTEGTMRVVLGLDEAQVAAHLPEGVWIANLNCPGQVVIAGSTAQMPLSEEKLKAAGARRILPLEVSGAFHTPLMCYAQEKLKAPLLSVSLQEGECALVMNVPGEIVESSQEIRHHLIEQAACPTRWEKGIHTIENLGAVTYIEIGPGKTLAGMNKKIGVAGQTLSVEKLSDLEHMHALYAQR